MSLKPPRLDRLPFCELDEHVGLFDHLVARAPAMPCFMATQELAAGRFVRVLPEYQYALGAMYVMYPPAKPLPAKVTAFTAYLREHAPRLL